MARYRARDILCIPLFLALHLLFILSSLFLRLVEALSTPPPRRLHTTSPKHIAVVLSSSSSGSRRGHAAGVSKEGEKRAVVQCVRRLVDWASDEGVVEISIWNQDGLVEQCKEEILGDVLRLPLSPPSSGPPSPTRGSASLPNTGMLANSNSSQHTLTVYAATSRPITLHLLPVSSQSTIADLARRYLDSARPTEGITQKLLDADVRSVLGFARDPDLLIVHPISPTPFLRALLPRAPPELHSYPFWPLRITEIYQHPTPLPLPHFVRDAFHSTLARAQMSTLPLVRKTARSLRPAEVSSDWRSVRGAMTRDVWEGALSAFSQVEQRLGK